MKPLILGVLFLGTAGAQSNEGAEDMLRARADLIRGSARAFAISPRLLASVVYAEHALNLRPGESVLEEVFARTGYNVSIGIAQIKVETAVWIEQNLHDPSSRFFLGEEASELIRKSGSYKELIDRLSADSVNLRYASAYLAMIEKLWGSTLQAPWLQNSRVGIFATVYSLGIAKSDGSLRLPHDQARMGDFGRKAQAFYDSFLLNSEFSE